MREVGIMEENITSKLSEENQKKIEALPINQVCQIAGCNRIKEMMLGLPSVKGAGHADIYPFCKDHGTDIREHRLKNFTLKNGAKYGKG
jgi:hypothetical protein